MHLNPVFYRLCVGCKIFFSKRTVFTFAVGAALFLSSCSNAAAPPNDNPDPRNPISIHVELGLPTDADSTDDYLVVREQYILSYNQNLNAANWASWNENADWYGDEPRCDCFTKDPLLPASFASVTTSDYTNSGYDRGHIVGSEARTKTAEDNRATFHMSNVFPQTPTLNRQTWLSMETFQDSLCKKANKELYVIAGGVYNTKNRINGKVAIPDSCWKIIVELPRGGKYGDVSAATKIHAVMMNNGEYNAATNDWRMYRTTVRNIEASSGYNFLKDLPQQLQDILENKR